MTGTLAAGPCIPASCPDRKCRETAMNEELIPERPVLFEKQDRKAGPARAPWQARHGTTLWGRQIQCPGGIEMFIERAGADVLLPDGRGNRPNLRRPAPAVFRHRQVRAD
jgi:hypothetical protein